MKERWYAFLVITFLTISQAFSVSPDNKIDASIKNRTHKEKHEEKGFVFKSLHNVKPEKHKKKLKSFPTLEHSSNSSEELEFRRNGTNLRRQLAGGGTGDIVMPWNIQPSDVYGGEMAKYDAVTSDTFATVGWWPTLAEKRQVNNFWENMKSRLYAEEHAHYYYRLRDYHEGEYAIIRNCYHIGTTYLNAMEDLEDYYHIRYLYSNTLEYDMGYLIHEIVRKYTITLELYHLVQYRFWNQSRAENIAPTQWMFYIYTNILDQVHDIIHLCNSLQELERKYTKPPQTPFIEIVIKKKRKRKGKKTKKERDIEKGIVNANEDIHYYDNESEEESKVPEMDLEEYWSHKRKQQKREHKAAQQTFIRDHIWESTMKTRRPVTFSDFPHHYGWSIEDW